MNLFGFCWLLSTAFVVEAFLSTPSTSHGRRIVVTGSGKLVLQSASRREPEKRATPLVFNRDATMLFSQSTDASHEVEQRYDTIQEKHVSLASSYLVEIHSEERKERWSLISISQVEGVKSDMAVGAQAIMALQSLASRATPSLILECTLSTAKDTNTLEVALSQQEGAGEENELVSVLSRILIQQCAAAETNDNRNAWTIHLPNEEPVTISDVASQQGVSKLFEPLLDMPNVEMVEMVRQNGSPLGIVPRPLVHKFNLLHRGIGMVITKEVPILSPGGNVKEYPDLYCHRRTDTKRIFPSLYDMFVGGVSSAGEDSATTAAREVAEELGLTRALSKSSPLSEPLFDCTVCTSYNRCVVTVFCYPMDPAKESVSWQEEEVAWGDFVPYSIVEASAELCIQRMVSDRTWPGSYPPAIPKSRAQSDNKSYDKHDWETWDYVPDGLLVWEAWLQWQNSQPST